MVYKHCIKRLLDVIISGFAMIVLSPVLLIVSILVKIKLGSPIVFKQERPGINGQIFKLYKFRTMMDPQTRDGKVLTEPERMSCLEQGIDILSDEERLTGFGKVLRATSLDELPELWNIFIGDMSMVGPRPLEVFYLPYYTKEEMRRHDVRPGLTGMAQINGRDVISWEKRFEYDIYYVDHVSFVLDTKIILQTIAVVFRQEGIAQGEEKPEAFSTVRQRQRDSMSNNMH